MSHAPILSAAHARMCGAVELSLVHNSTSLCALSTAVYAAQLIIKSISLRNNDYLVKVEDSSIGANGYLVIPKDVFEFIFKEKGDYYVKTL